MAPHSTTLAWKIPWTEEHGRLQSMGSRRVRLDWATSLSLFTFVHWRRKWQPNPALLPGESQGWWSLMGCHLRVAQSWTWLKQLSSSSSSSKARKVKQYAYSVIQSSRICITWGVICALFFIPHVNASQHINFRCIKTACCTIMLLSVVRTAAWLSHVKLFLMMECKYVMNIEVCVDTMYGQCVKKQWNHSADKGPYSQAMVFPAVMCRCENWAIKKAENQRTDASELWCLRRLESPLDFKEIQPVSLFFFFLIQIYLF